ncbi:hypothetical protein LOC68_16575 [Blastopirellula sp. JC732]|uniref:Transporter n=1 Tax=Blastopirellula sediminis TaxID=2894196 RepID=A0A9X1MNN7_9BACT|nr:hypothetical protein [Blastopirellula sediminis]MCC9606693.1 hypothetical protein [Blastopirellula sediminis]MCC9630009.1 hypothetical protein [Blastopirellula sediminis]
MRLLLCAAGLLGAAWMMAGDLRAAEYVLISDQSPAADASLVSYQYASLASCTDCGDLVGCDCGSAIDDSCCGDVAGCGSSCGQMCGCNSCCGHDCWLTKFLVPSDHCYDDFISPMTNPVYFEDPRTLTEARFIYLHHQIPTAALGGHVNLLAVQLRAALTENLSIIATKDGFATSTSPLIDDGWADVAAGLKYNLYKDPFNQRLLSAGFTYEMPVGSTRTLQGNGDGVFDIFLTGGAQFGYNNHFLSTTGFLLPCDKSAESSIWFWSNHIDHRIAGTKWYVLGEMNWYHYMSSGKAFSAAPIEGGDLFNLGTVGVAGNDIVTGALGVKYKPSSHMELGFAWETPLTERRDVLQNRITVDAIFRY